MTLRAFATLAALLALAGCSSVGSDGATVVDESPERIRIVVDHDAAFEGVNARRKAEDHCAGYGKRAVWYGHDRSGAMEFRCE